jgi:hypothetical protein
MSETADYDLEGKGLTTDRDIGYQSVKPRRRVFGAVAFTPMYVVMA